LTILLQSVKIKKRSAVSFQRSAKIMIADRW
jgi:hypothetical protein